MSTVWKCMLEKHIKKELKSRISECKQRICDGQTPFGSELWSTLFFSWCQMWVSFLVEDFRGVVSTGDGGTDYNSISQTVHFTLSSKLRFRTQPDAAVSLDFTSHSFLWGTGRDTFASSWNTRRLSNREPKSWRHFLSSLCSTTFCNSVQPLIQHFCLLSFCVPAVFCLLLLSRDL